MNVRIALTKYILHYGLKFPDEIVVGNRTYSKLRDELLQVQRVIENSDSNMGYCPACYLKDVKIKPKIHFPTLDLLESYYRNVFNPKDLSSEA